MSDADYRRAAEVVYTQMRQLFDHTIKVQAEYGRWLISSLLLLHTGAIAGLLFKSAGSAPPPYLGAIWFFVFGIIFALGSGFAAWWNFTLQAEQYDAWADHRMLTDPAHWPKDPLNERGITVMLWLAVIAGLISATLMLIGAGAVWCAWRP